jgi:aspartyl-tRNA(Asn)/glutamyl-tRNA(Gln) amidotransferase subunit B
MDLAAARGSNRGIDAVKYVATIGLETHVQLRTQSKIFCGCSTAFGAQPNTHVCPVCLGLPGAMPVLNREAVRLTVVSGLLLGCRINGTSKFDRKNYYYPDMPKNYQISQYDRPLCLGGSVEIRTAAGPKTVHLTRIHLEEDVAKNLHFEQSSGIDFNRAGTPLMEIVTEPDMESADEAFEYLQALKQILLYGGVSDCNLEEGNVRCDLNVSVRPEGTPTLGVKVEIKNMNTFKGVHRALTYEIRRQIDVKTRGGTLVQETRRWDDEAGVTESMRTKEQAHDYRYFPEPDLMPVVLDDATVEAWRAALPELPDAKRQRFVGEYGLPAYDAGVLTADPALADFFEAAARASGNFKAVSNWIMTDVMRVMSEREATISTLPLTATALAGLVALVERKAVNMPTAKEVFAELVDRGGDPAEIVKRRGLGQVSDAGAIEAFADQAIAAHPGPAAEFRAGKAPALQFLIGQVMKLSRGKANPQLAAEVLRRKLGAGA